MITVQGRQVRIVTVMMVALLALLPASAQAQNGFSDFRVAADNQYGEPPPPHSNAGGNGNGNGNPGGGANKPKSKEKLGGGPSGNVDGDGNSGRRRDSGVASAGAGRENGSSLPSLAEAQGGSLPFTGADAGTIAMLGLLLLAVGLLGRAIARTRRQPPGGNRGLSSRARA